MIGSIYTNGHVVGLLSLSRFYGVAEEYILQFNDEDALFLTKEQAIKWTIKNNMELIGYL